MDNHRYDNECPICCNNMDGLEKTPMCGHTLCFHCYERIDACPMCRCEYSPSPIATPSRSLVRYHHEIVDLSFEDTYDTPPTRRPMQDRSRWKRPIRHEPVAHVSPPSVATAAPLTANRVRAPSPTRRSARVMTERFVIHAHPDDMDMLHDALNSMGYYLSGTELHHYSRGTEDTTRR